MASTYSTHLRYEKQATGENEATWGARLNTVIDLIEDSLAGVETLDCSGGSDITLTTSNSTTDQQRMAILKCTGVMTASINIITPDNNTKQYVVWNATTGAYTIGIKTTSGTALSVPQGDAVHAVTDGTNYVDVNSHPSYGTVVTKDHGTASGEVPLNSDLGTSAIVDHGTGASEIPLNSDLGTVAILDTGTADAQVPTNGDLGTASTKNTGTSSGQVPLNSDLGTAAVVDTGVTAGTVVLHENFGTAAFVNTGTGSTQVPTNASLGTAAYVNTGTSASNVPTVTNGNGLWLGISAKAADSNLLDGLDSTAYAQLGGTQSFSGVKTFTAATSFADGTAASPSMRFAADTNTGFFRKTTDSIGFACAGTERAYLDSAGSFFNDGNTWSGGVYGFSADTDTYMYRRASNQIGWVCGGTERLYLTDGGALYADSHLSAGGNVYGVIGAFSNNVYAYSDMRLKTNTAPVSDAVNKIKQLDGFTYDRTDIDGRFVGTSAQQVQSVLPEAVGLAEDGETLTLAYGNLAALWIEGFKELDARLAKLEK